ncbi:hypothetical protein [Nocardia sp. NPDC049707]|uniref:hypothetical protein n=1 Tax=Nocardia sp. NPDC049707 TaxID=3154735 RepID=UPI003435CCBD
MSVYTIRVDGSESTGPEGIYLVWGYDWGGYDARECATLDDALHTYWAWDDSDYGGPEYIEGPTGVVPAKDVEAWTRAQRVRSDERSTAYRASLFGQIRYAVELRELGGNTVIEFDSTEDLSDAIGIIGRLNRPGRCRIVQTVFTEDRGWVTERVVIDWAPTSTEQQAA